MRFPLAAESFGALTLFAANAASASTAQLVDDGECDCFLVNGSAPTYYSQHSFFDFRSLSEYAGPSEVISNPNDSSIAPPTSDYFDSKPWNDMWELQGWDNREEGGQGELSGDATVLMVNSPNNVYIQENDDKEPASDTFLTMRTRRLPDFQTAAEFQAKRLDYQYLSLRMLARTTGSPGAVTAMFTYRHSDELAKVQEADIEILTNGPREKVQYTNQPSYTEDGEDRKDATRNATMPGGLRWSDWSVHRLDWTPSRSIWYVDGAEVANIEFQTPRDPSGLNFNVWSNGGSWSGNMSTYDEAFMQIQWIEMVFNTTGHVDDENHQESRRAAGTVGQIVPRDDNGGCGVVCSIDETGKTGRAAMLWDSGAAGKPLHGAFEWTSMTPWLFLLATGSWVVLL
ncbi:Beta-glucanase [Paramyrothecium foliicola]|nr:Beta-glucanase [Paramyrothecium foliicola]